MRRSYGSGAVAGTSGLSCGCIVVILITNLLLGGFAVDYCTNTIAGLNAPFWADCIAGLFLGQFAVPLMIICWFLQVCGVHVPFFHLAQ